MSGFRSSTIPAELAWGVSLVAVGVVDVLLWRGRRGKRFGWRLEPVRAPWPRLGQASRRSALLGVSLWLLLGAVVLAWEILGIDTGTHQPHLTISALTLAYRPLEAAMLMAWMLAGVGAGAARARRPVGTPGPPAVPPDFTPSLALVPALLLPRNRQVGVMFWIGVALCAVAVDQIGRRSGGRLADAEELVGFVTATRSARTILALAWVYAGYHLFAH